MTLPGPAMVEESSTNRTRVSIRRHLKNDSIAEQAFPVVVFWLICVLSEGKHFASSVALLPFYCGLLLSPAGAGGRPMSVARRDLVSPPAAERRHYRDVFDVASSSA